MESKAMPNIKSNARIATNEYTNAAVEALGSCGAFEPLVATDHRNRRSKKDTLEQPNKQIEIGHEFSTVVPIVMYVNADNINAIEVTASDAHEISHHCQSRYQKQARQKPRHDQITNRIGTHR